MDVYNDRPVEGRRTRILELAPGEPTDELVGDLKAVPLDEDADYEAISYVWGSNIFSETIGLPSEQLQITASLDGALRRFRDREQTRRLWTDSICINQQDLQERSQQVALMGDIYRQARQVLIWVGKADDVGEMSGLGFWAMQFLSDFAVAERLPCTHAEGSEETIDLRRIEGLNRAFLEALRQCQNPRYAAAKERKGGRSTCMGLLTRLGLRSPASPAASVESGDGTSRRWKLNCPCRCNSMLLTADERTCFVLAMESFAMVMARPWFGRMWVMQEAALAQKAVFHCGSHELPLRKVFYATSTIKQLIEWRCLPSWPHTSIVGRASSFFTVVNGFARPGAGGGLGTMLEKTRGLDCSEPRDRVYGVLSMVDENTMGRIPITPDYAIPMAKLWANVAACWLTSKPVAFGAKPYEVLCLAGLLDRHTPEARPSWAPDFNRLAKEGADAWKRKSEFLRTGVLMAQSPFSGRFYPYEHTEYCASRSSTSVVTYDDAHWGRLGLRGMPVNKLASILPGSQFPAHPREGESPLSPVEAADYAEHHLFPWYIKCLHFAFVDQAHYEFWKPILALIIRQQGQIPCIPDGESSSDVAVGDEHIHRIRSAAARAIATANGTETSQDGIQIDAEQMLTDLAFFYGKTANSWSLDLDRIIATTADNRIAFVPSRSRTGDIIFLFAGVPVPLVVRPSIDEDGYELVGDAYVEGHMFGDKWPENGLQRKDGVQTRVAFFV